MKNNVTLEDLSLDSSAPIEEILKKLKAHGAVVIPAWIEPIKLKALTKDFYEILKDNDGDYIYKIGYPAGEAVSLMRDSLPQGRYSAINEVFSNSLMNQVVKRYVGDNGLVNYEVYATHEHKPSVHVAPTHHDKLWSLKFMLYLNDIGKDNAPFGVIPGSAACARQRFREIFEKNQLQRLSMSSPLYQSIDNSTLPQDSGPVVDITGPAGTMIIFDTDTFHHAGSVAAGKERMILRGHSGPSITYTSVRRNSRQWWRGEKRFSKLDDWLDKAADQIERTFTRPLK